MNKKLFSELIASLREGGAILRGEIKPSRRFKVINGEPVLCVDELDPSLHSGQALPRACGDCGRPLQAVRPGEWQCEGPECPSNTEMG